MPWRGEVELLEGRRSSRMVGERWSSASVARPSMQRASAAYTCARYIYNVKVIS